MIYLNIKLEKFESMKRNVNENFYDQLKLII